MYKLVVFDLDGTLADTLADLAGAVNSALKEHNIKPHPIESYNKFVGNGINNLISQVLGDKAGDVKLHKSIKAYFDEYYPKHLCDDTVAYDGMSDVLRFLSDNGVKIAVHSNKPHAYVPHILDKLYPDFKFDIAWGHQECFLRKPSPQALLAMMDILEVSNSDVLYVGDSDVDVYTAHSADVRVCGVQWGFRGKEELLSAGADYIAETPQELIKIIKG